MTSRHRRLVAALALTGAGVLVACGGEERLDNAAFCDEFVAIGPGAQGSGAAIATGLEELAPRAPTPELGDAVTAVAEVFTAYDRVASEGGDAGAELARLGEDPEVLEAVTTFGDFLTDECGLELGVPLDDGAVPADGSTVPADGSDGSNVPADDGTVPAG